MRLEAATNFLGTGLSQPLYYQGGHFDPKGAVMSHSQACAIDREEVAFARLGYKGVLSSDSWYTV